MRTVGALEGIHLDADEKVRIVGEHVEVYREDPDAERVVAYWSRRDGIRVFGTDGAEIVFDAFPWR